MNEIGQVGIFWAVPDAHGAQLVTEATDLAAADRYGDALTHPSGHDDTWTRWQSLGALVLARRGLPAAIVWHEYDELPRGRVVFHTSSGLFTVYADQLLLTPPLRTRLGAIFTLPLARTRFLTDLQYRVTVFVRS